MNNTKLKIPKPLYGHLITIFYILTTILLSLLLFLPYSVKIQNSVVNVIDPLFYAWNLHFNSRFIPEGLKNAINANIYYPLTNTIAYSDTLWTQSLLASPIIWLTKNSVFAENLLVLLSFPMSSYFMYLLCLYLTKHRLSSFMTGIIFAFSYPRIAQIGHLPYVSSQFIPLVILFTLKYFDKGKIKNLLAAYLSYVLATSSSIYFGIFLIPMLFVVSTVKIIFWIKHRELDIFKDRMIKLLAFSIPIGLGLLITNYPYLKLRLEHPEYKRTLFVTMDLRAFPVDYISVTTGSLLHKIGFPAKSAEHVLYPTFVSLIFGILGVIYLWKNNKNILFIFLLSGLTAMILSFGAEQTIFGKTIKLPFYYLFITNPLFQIVRVPARLGLFALFCLTVLASFGLKQILKGKYKYLLSAFILSLFIIEIWQIYTPYVSVPLKNNFPEVYTWLKYQPDPIVVAELPMKLFYNGSPMENQLMKGYDELSELDNYASETYRLYFSTLHNKNMVNGYSGFFPDEYNKISDAGQSFPSDYSIAVLKDFGVTTLILHGNQFLKNFREIETDLEKRDDIEFVINFDNDYVYKFIK